MAVLYKRKNGYWYLRFEKDGKPKWRSLKTRDEDRAHKLATKVVRGLEPDKKAPEPAGLSFEELKRRYTEWAELHLATATVESRCRALKAFQEHSGLSTVDAITKTHIEAYKAHRAATSGTPRTVNESIQALKALVGRAKRQGWYAKPNPFIGVEMLPEPKRHVRWLDTTEVAKLLETAELYDRDLYLSVALGLYAGMRKLEIVNARWEWLDWSAKLIHIEGAENWETKTRQVRTVPLAEKLRIILEPHQAAAGYIVAPRKNQGKHRYRYDFKKGFQAVAKAVGVPWATPHTLRHTFASQLVSAGVDLYKVSVWLGHSTMRTTQRYAHLRPYDADINRF